MACLCRGAEPDAFRGVGGARLARRVLVWPSRGMALSGVATGGGQPFHPGSSPAICSSVLNGPFLCGPVFAAASEAARSRGRDAGPDSPLPALRPEQARMVQYGGMGRSTHSFCHAQRARRPRQSNPLYLLD
eukprot:7344362-Pyramimonas_sp.AAC.1